MSRRNYNNYNKISKPIETPIIESDEIIIEEGLDMPKKNPVFGVVSNCKRLNIRKEPSKDSEILCDIIALTELEIDIDKSTDDWYKVFNADGIEGFCMKRFVELK